MKRLATVLVVAALAALTLYPVTPQVNDNFGKDNLRADGGMPAPPSPPGGVLIAEGPMPPFPPGRVLIAEGGMPAPPFPRGGVTA